METILVVDDERQPREVLTRILEREGYSCLAAASASEAQRLLASHDVAVLLCDINMPGESGLSLMHRVVAEHPGTAAIMITGIDDPAIAEKALEYGAHGYITKTPFKSSELLVGVANALRSRGLKIENERRLSTAREETVRRLAAAVESRDHGTGRHIKRMSEICVLLAERLGIDPAHCELIREASQLHDVGKIAVPDEILLKPGALTADERRRMERHAEAGYRLLAGSDSELLELAATIARTHHENFDGTGYPRGLTGTEIPLEGRIAAVADVFDALTQDRPYREAMSVDEAVKIIVDGCGTKFDPLVVNALLSRLDEIPPGPDAAEEAIVA
jgi:putative two-component system response regulator